MSDPVSNEPRSHADIRGVEFMILSRGRTGSTVIVDDIDMHPDISCYQEVFSLSSEVQKTLPVPAYCEFEKTFAGTPTPAAYFQHLWDIEPEGIRALGYKVLMHHIEDYPDRSGYLLS